MSLISTKASALPATIPMRVFPYRNAHALLFSLIVLGGVLDAIWLPASGVSLNLSFLWIGALIVLPLGLLWGFYSFIRYAPPLSLTLLATLQMFLFTNTCGILSYLIMGIGWPWRDHLLASGDQWLGLDWPAYVTFIEHVPWLYRLLGCLYYSSLLQIAGLTLILGYCRRFKELTELVAIIILGGIAAIVIGPMLPALGAYKYFNLADHGIASYIGAITAAHDRTLAVIDPRHLEGLVVFPSYHTILSIGIIVAGWSLRYLRYPILCANLLLIAGVPVFGGHYFVDLLGGAAVTAMVIWVWRRWTAWVDAPKDDQKIESPYGDSRVN